MPDAEPPKPPTPYLLVVIDHDQGFFSVEGPMTDDRGWQAAVRRAWSHHRRIECGPTGPDREALAAEFSQTLNLAGMPPGNILRPHP